MINCKCNTWQYTNFNHEKKLQLFHSNDLQYIFKPHSFKLVDED